MKRIFPTALACLFSLIIFSCVNDVDNDENSLGSKHLTFSVSYNIEQEDMSRASSSLSDYISSLAFFDYKNGEIENSIVQSSSDNAFGTLSADISFGEHTFLFVGHNSTSCSYDVENSELSFTGNIKDTFTFYTTLKVNSELPSEESEISLERQVAMVKLSIKDAIPENAAKIEVCIDGYSDRLNPVTGIASNNYKHTRTWEYSEEHIGMLDTSYIVYTFVSSDEETNVTVSVTVRDANGEVLKTRTINQVPIKKNFQTVIQGNFFDTSFGSSIVIASEWNGFTYEVPL